MCKKTGIVIVILGLALIISALVLHISNKREDNAADKESARLLKEIKDKIPEDNDEDGMSVVEVDGLNFLGYLTIPDIKKELPVLAEWSYLLLKKAPCRHWGSYLTDDFVIAAHNYKSHFGDLNKLKKGAAVFFTDATGTQHHYKVVATKVLQPTDTEEVRSGGYDLVLYTCTVGGEQRIVVFCERAKET